jgi:prepilin-type N-terminal cleavage/methylation domain-containing protein
VSVQGRRGFTLVEAVIALAVLAVGLVLAGSILVQAYRMLGQLGVEARTPAADLVLARLRSELQSASGVWSGGSSGSDSGSGPSAEDRRLELVYPDGHRVRYEVRGSRLWRRELAPPGGAEEAGAGEPSGRGSDGGSRRRSEEWSAPRRILDGVTSWRWRRVGTRLVTVEVAYRSAEARDRVVDPARSGPVDGNGGTQVRRTLVTALRGGGLGWGW